MGTDTGIEWTDATWNPVRGCSRVSPGCENCYAETMAARFAGPGQAYEGLARHASFTKGVMRDKRPARWTGVVRMVPEHLADPLRWRKPRRIFVNSMSDLFHEKLTNEEIAAVFGVMAANSRHTFQVLTKRAERMREWFWWVEEKADRGNVWGRADVCQYEAFGRLDEAGRKLLLHPIKGVFKSWPWPLPNVWLGVSVEDQRRADERIPLLLETPAAVRFISAEPLLGPVDLSRFRKDRCDACGDEPADCGHGLGRINVTGLDWVIAGAESGPGARPAQLAWYQSLRSQCTEAGVAFFMKQMVVGGKLTKDMNEFPADLRVREWPKETRQ